MDRLRFALAWFMCYSYQYFYPNPEKWMGWDDKLQTLKRNLRNG
jgi:hypothetical protein